MLDVARPGQLQQYFAGIRRLTELFPNEWASIGSFDEELRSEIWPRLYQEIQEGVKPAPRNFDANKPWGSIIAESRFDYLQGSLADHWRRQEVKLERALRNKPGGKSLGGAPVGAAPPPLPGHQASVGKPVASGWGSGRAPGTPSAPGQGKKAKQRAKAAAGKAHAYPQANPQTKGKGKGKRRGPPDNYEGCFFCKSKTHFLRDCTAWIAAGKPDVEGAPRPKKVAK